MTKRSDSPSGVIETTSPTPSTWPVTMWPPSSSPSLRAGSRFSRVPSTQRSGTVQLRVSADISTANQASPAERKAFRQQLRQQIEDLTPEQRQALVQQTRKRWQNLPPGEQQRLADERRAQIEAMSPAERRELLRQRRDMLRGLSPEERAALRDRLPVR